MKRVHTIHVVASLPPKLRRLREIAMDMHWCWNHDAIDLFRRLDQDIWRDIGQNPMKMLAVVPQERLDKMAEDGGFLSHLERVWLDFEVYRSERTWYQSNFPNVNDMKVAYFSAEFGLHECLPVYSGGLGVLAGDHLKAASDMGVPIVGIGLMYQRGYFRQYLNADGWQQERYPETDVFHVPMELVIGQDNEPLEFSVRVAVRDVVLHIWRVKLGRIDLYLLDSNVLANHPDDRRITELLYGGDTEMRIRQEIVLGIGGVYALEKLGIDVNVYHMNEGHSAFLALERIRRVMNRDGLTFEEALVAACSAHAFTTHTPVPAGIDKFSQSLMEKYFHEFWPSIGLDKRKFMALGGADSDDPESAFNMAIMAIGFSSYTNGVSDLHAEVSKGMWKSLWPEINKDEVPIDSVKNGIHARSWISGEMSVLFDRYLGPKWQENPTDKELWKSVSKISTEELWRVRQRQRQRLVSFARSRLTKQLQNRGESASAVERAREILDMGTLTIGFARRFATYKRATLLFRDKERLKRILTNPKMPVQMIFAGKAHPRDDGGKQLIREIVHFARDEEIRNKIVFIEDYDIDIARHMVQGCDIWLNTPRPPHEASGTSGMKAAVNGVLHCSTYDGWWADCFNREIGFVIGGGESYDDEEYQDQVEGEALYDLLEGVIIPMFYSRSGAGVPRDWVAMVKQSLEQLCPVYITTRMVEDYTRKAYLPIHARSKKLLDSDNQRAINLTKWKQKVHENWNQVEILNVETTENPEIETGDSIKVKVNVRLGSLSHEDVRVELVVGKLHGNRELTNPVGHALQPLENGNENEYVYCGEVKMNESGNHGFAVRLLPANEDLNEAFSLGCITWE